MFCILAAYGLIIFSGHSTSEWFVTMRCIVDCCQVRNKSVTIISVDFCNAFYYCTHHDISWIQPAYGLIIINNGTCVKIPFASNDIGLLKNYKKIFLLTYLPEVVATRWKSYIQVEPNLASH